MRSRSRGPLKVLYQSINQSTNQSLFILKKKIKILKFTVIEIIIYIKPFRIKRIKSEIQT